MTRIGASKIAILLAGAVWVAGCDDEEAADMGVDMAAALDMTAAVGDMAADAAAADMAGADLAGDAAVADAAPPDLTGADLMTRTCLQIVGCLQACGDDQACQDACIASGDQMSQDTARALLACSYGVCTMATDAGAASCASDMDRSAPCRACLTAAAASPDCTTQYMACLTDT